MIPLPVAPLTGITVLVTRPNPQAQSLCARIAALGGESIAFPTIAIEPVQATPHDCSFDWVIFVSAPAVAHGFVHVARNTRTRIAAIGKATAAALAGVNVVVDATPDESFTSEALLDHPAFLDIANQQILIVKGEGGRNLLQEQFAARGAHVATLDVYRRMRPAADPKTIELLEQRWCNEHVDIVTLTSVETLENLWSLLSDAGRAMLRSTPYVALSARIIAAAEDHGLVGAPVLARSGDDDAIVGAIAAWYTRAR